MNDVPIDSGIGLLEKGALGIVAFISLSVVVLVFYIARTLLPVVVAFITGVLEAIQEIAPTMATAIKGEQEANRALLRSMHEQTHNTLTAMSSGFNKGLEEIRNELRER